jgi:glyoxalase/bleomycin resistance protein/dioxygenase superfamily protein
MTKARLTEQAPVLLASNLMTSVEFWKQKAGFSARLYGEPPDFAILRRDRVFLMLSQAPEDHAIVPYWKIKDKLWNAYFWVDDAKALYEEFLSAGMPIDYHLGIQSYNVLEFGIQDPDGYDIAFGQDLEG